MAEMIHKKGNFNAFNATSKDVYSKVLVTESQMLRLEGDKNHAFLKGSSENQTRFRATLVAASAPDLNYNHFYAYEEELRI